MLVQLIKTSAGNIKKQFLGFMVIQGVIVFDGFAVRKVTFHCKIVTGYVRGKIFVTELRNMLIEMQSECRIHAMPGPCMYKK